MSDVAGLYRRWIEELWGGAAVAGELSGEWVAGRWTCEGASPEGPVRFVGNDLLRVSGGRFVEYWPATVTMRG